MRAIPLLLLGAVGCASGASMGSESDADAGATVVLVFPSGSPHGQPGEPTEQEAGTVTSSDAGTAPAPGSADAGAPAPSMAGMPMTGTPTTLAAGTSMLALTVAGTARSAVVYVPAGAASNAPLVIALHGDGDTDTNFLATSGLQPLADQNGLVLVLPQGITRDIMVDGQLVPQVDWDAYTPVGQGNIDEPFLEELRTRMQATGQVDAQRTFVFGYSQGGYMSFFYGMSDSSVLSCAAVLAASSPYGGGAGDPLITGATRQIPVTLQIGTEDYAYQAAQATYATLMSMGFPTQWNSIEGAGHVPIPGDVSVPLQYCLSQTL